MKHVLDNPAFNALATGNQDLDRGNEAVKYFDSSVAPFVGFKENTDDNFNQAYQLVPHVNPVVFIARNKIDAFGDWKVLNCIPGWQMVYSGDVFEVNNSNLVPLTEEHIPQMLELTQLTNPGPFGPNTINFGHYQGVFNGDKLVAMAGQRLNPLPYAEISAVCTHPDHSGKGYARQLMQFQANRIKAAGQIPFLHVRDDNTRAIKVYKDLGFEIFDQVYFYVLAK